MSQHTPEPWRSEVNQIWAQGDVYIGDIHGGEGTRFIDGEVNAECAANLRRVIACVNALAGIPTEALEAGVVGELLQVLSEVGEDAAADGAVSDRTLDSALAVARKLQGSLPDPA